jgi:hypothetical protein
MIRESNHSISRDMELGRIDCSQLPVNSIRVQMRHSCEMD